MPKTSLPRCAECPFKLQDRRCRSEEGRYPPFCPTMNHPDVAAASQAVYAEPGVNLFARQAAVVEKEGYIRCNENTMRPMRPRILEIVDFAKRMEYKRLALLFCLGLRSESQVTATILENHGFEVASVVCKVSCTSKASIGLTPDQQIYPDQREVLCNPVMQAELVNAMNVDFTILLGLCVGHDTLAIKHLTSPVTVFAVKDRLLGHNPLAAIYTSELYYRFIKSPETSHI